MYGEVTYQRIVYEVIEEDGTRRFVYLLDETLELATCRSDLDEHGGTAGKRDYGTVVQRVRLAKVSEMTGQTISAMGVWNVIQALGEKICEEEEGTDRGL